MNTYGLSRPIAATAEGARAGNVERTGRCLDILATMATAERAGAAAGRAKRRTVSKAKRTAKPVSKRAAGDTAAACAKEHVGVRARDESDDVGAHERIEGRRMADPCADQGLKAASDSDCAHEEGLPDETLPTASGAGSGGADEAPPACADCEDERGKRGSGAPNDEGDAADEAVEDGLLAACSADAERADVPVESEPEASVEADGARAVRGGGEAAVRASDAHAPADEPRERPPLSDLSNKQIGQRGEDAAARFLKNKGYRILDRNWKCPAGEADIVAMDCEVLVFIEVKTRTGIEAGMPEEAVTPEKRARYERIAAYYLRDFRSVEMPIRFDVIGILVVAEDRAILKHHINAFAVA